MAETAQRENEPHIDPQRLAELIPKVGEANARRILTARFSEAQRDRIADIVRNHPPLPA